jgi:hypothetical protein
LDRAEALRALKAITEPGQVTELRILKAGNLKTISGYFDTDHHEALVEAAASYDARAPAIYVTLNPVIPDLLARACNRERFRVDVGETTADQHILKRHLLLLDADPERPSGISSTDAEHDAALALMQQIVCDLGKDGWPKAILADSGNGAHALFVIDLPNDDPSKQLVQAVLKAFAKRFDNGTVKVDQSVFNAARIVKLYGSVARKGDSTRDRPHRLSRLLEVPPTLEIVPFELLVETARQVEPPRQAPRAVYSPTDNGTPAIQGFDIERWIADHGLSVRGPFPYSGGRKWQLDCPFNPDHRAPDAIIVQNSNGSLAFHCSHNSCAAYHWREFRERIEGARPARPQAAKAEFNEGRAPTISIGDFVQWESQGVLRFAVPLKVCSLSDDGQWAFVEGSATGLPIKDLYCVPPPDGDATTETQPILNNEKSDLAEGKQDAVEPKASESVDSLITELQATPDAALLYQNIDRVAKLSDTELAVLSQELKAILKRKLIMIDFRKAIKETRTRQRKSEVEAASERRLSGHPYRISHAGGMVRVVEKKAGTEIVPLANFVATIQEDITEDDGVETRRFFRIAARLGNRDYSFIIAASELALMNWAIEHIGPSAIVNPNQQDWVRAAVQSLSTSIQQRRIYTHTGWRKAADTHVYLHAGGAIGAAGAVANIEVHLAGPLGHFELQPPGSNQELAEAIRASLRMIDLAKGKAKHIIFVLLAAVYRACLKGCDFSIWIAGPTGVFKTEVAALAQQHFGRAMNSRHLPGNFSSTGNSLEALAFGAKDTLLAIDDFAPHGSLQDVARYYATADRILRAAGNSQGRGRLSSDARLREAKPPRGLIIVTGEDLPKGQSIRGRTFMLEIAQGDIDAAELTKCQADAASGAYARAMAGFIRWIAAQYETVQGEYAAIFAKHRDKATRAHSRTPGIVADLSLGFRLFLDFAVDAGAITADEKDPLADRCWKALQNVAASQRVRQEASEPAHRFLELLRAAILSGDAHVAGLGGSEPSEPARWGWHTIGTGENERWVGAGRCVGWLAGSDLFLEPTASYAVAQEMGRGTGEPLVVSETTLRKRLHERGLLASVDVARETLTVRKTVHGREMPVLHLLAGALASPAAQPAANHGEAEEFKC